MHGGGHHDARDTIGYRQSVIATAEGGDRPGLIPPGPAGRKYRWWEPLRISSRIWPRSRTILVAAMALAPASGEKPHRRPGPKSPPRRPLPPSGPGRRGGWSAHLPFPVGGAVVVHLGRKGLLQAVRLNAHSRILPRPHRYFRISAGVTAAPKQPTAVVDLPAKMFPSRTQRSRGSSVSKP